MRAIEPCAPVRAAGSEPCGEGEAIGVDGAVGERREQPRRPRAAQIVRAAERAEDGRVQPCVDVAAGRRVDRSGERGGHLVDDRRSRMGRARRQSCELGAGHEPLWPLARFVRDPEADAPLVVDGACAHLRGQQVRSRRRVHPRRDAVEARRFVHRVVARDVHAVEHQASLPGGREAQDQLLIARHREPRGQPRAALLARRDEQVERDALHRRERAGHDAPGDLVAAPRIACMRVSERRRRRLGTVLGVQTAAGVAEGAEERERIDHAELPIGAGALLRPLVGRRLAGEDGGLVAHLVGFAGRRGRVGGDALERLARVYRVPAFRELGDRRERGESRVLRGAGRESALGRGVDHGVQRGVGPAGRGRQRCRACPGSVGKEARQSQSAERDRSAKQQDRETLPTQTLRCEHSRAAQKLAWALATPLVPLPRLVPGAPLARAGEPTSTSPAVAAPPVMTAYESPPAPPPP